MKTTTNSKPFRLFVPDLWRPTIDEFSRVNDRFDRAVSIVPLDVSDTGIKDPVYEELSDRKDGPLTIFMLPVAHCALNISDHELQIIGPAISTRNDIFIFRRNTQVRVNPKKKRFLVAVREKDITTSNILRIVAANSTFDLFMHADTQDLPEFSSANASMRQLMQNGLFKCSDERKCATERLELVLDGTCDAAIFTGDELNIPVPGTSSFQSLFDHEHVIDAYNLNREINNFYHIRSLPRAVLCTRGVGDERLEAVDAFSELYTTCAKAVRAQAQPNNSERSRHIPVPTGRASEKIDVSTLMRFTADMHSEAVHNLRVIDLHGSGLKELEKSRTLRHEDFIYWNSVYKDDLKSALIQSMNDYHETRQGKIGSSITDFEETIEEQLDALPDLPRTEEAFTRWLVGVFKGMTTEFTREASGIWNGALAQLRPAVSTPRR